MTDDRQLEQYESQSAREGLAIKMESEPANVKHSDTSQAAAQEQYTGLTSITALQGSILEADGSGEDRITRLRQIRVLESACHEHDTNIEALKCGSVSVSVD